MFDLKSFLFVGVRTKQVINWICHSGQQPSAVFENAESLPPNWADFGAKYVGYRMENQVERLVCKHRQVAHVSLDGADRQAFPGSYQAITIKLCGGIVEDGDICSQRGKDWSLLSAATS